MMYFLVLEFGCEDNDFFWFIIVGVIFMEFYGCFLVGIVVLVCIGEVCLVFGWLGMCGVRI